MPKILYLITELDIGGAEKNLFRLAVALKERGWDVEVACLSGRGEVGAWLEKKGVQVHYIAMGARVRPGWFVRLVKLLRRVRPDILHTFLFHANVGGRLANLFGRIPVVVSSVRVAERRRRSHLYMDFLTQRLVDREVCVSQGVREFTRHRAHIREDKLVVIPNPVEPLEAERSRGEVRESFGATEDDVVFLSVGRLDVQKGYEYLVDAAARLLASHPNVLFLIAGEGDSRGGIEKRISQAGVGARFRLLGWRRDVADLYAAADVFVLPSLWEGMPNALLEAASFGLPVVATAVEGSREVVADGETGLLVLPRDTAALSDALEKVLTDADLRRRIGDKAKRSVFMEHDPEKFVMAHENLYRELLGK